MISDLEKTILLKSFKNLKYSIREIINPDAKVTEYDVFFNRKDLNNLESNLKNLNIKVFKIKKILLPKFHYQYFLEVVKNERYLILDIHCYLPLHRKNWLTNMNVLDVIIDNSFLQNDLYFINNNMFNTILLVKALIYLKFPINEKHKLSLEKEILNYEKELDGKYNNLILEYLPIESEKLKLSVNKIVNKKDYKSFLFNNLKAPYYLSLKLLFDSFFKKYIIPLLLKRQQLICKELSSEAVEKYAKFGFNVIVTDKKNLKYYIRTFTGISILSGQNECNFYNIFDVIKDKYMLELK